MFHLFLSLSLFFNYLCRFSPLCHLCVSRHPRQQLLWQFPCWSSWLLSSCCSLTPPNSMRGSKASSGLLWWGAIFKNKNGENFLLFLCFIWTMVFLSFLSKDFLRCVTASITFFIISIIAVSKYVDGSSKAAGVKLKVWISLWRTPTQFMYYFVTSFSLCWYQMSFFSQVFGFIATIVFALDFYFIFNELANFLKEGGESNVESSRQQGNTPNENLVIMYWYMNA